MNSKDHIILKNIVNKWKDSNDKMGVDSIIYIFTFLYDNMFGIFDINKSSCLNDIPDNINSVHNMENIDNMDNIDHIDNVENMENENDMDMDNVDNIDDMKNMDNVDNTEQTSKYDSNFINSSSHSVSHSSSYNSNSLSSSKNNSSYNSNSSIKDLSVNNSLDNIDNVDDTYITFNNKDYTHEEFKNMINDCNLTLRESIILNLTSEEIGFLYKFHNKILNNNYNLNDDIVIEEPVQPKISVNNIPQQTSHKFSSTTSQRTMSNIDKFTENM